MGYSETVFINDLAAAEVSIFALQNEIPFAGAPLVATALYINDLSAEPVESITCLGNKIDVSFEANLTWVTKDDITFLPNWNLLELETPEDVKKLFPEHESVQEHTYAWSWIDKDAGTVRARTFAIDWEIPEEEANGSGSMLLSNQVGRSLNILHGKGSTIHTKLGDSGISLGGRVDYL